MRISYYFLLIFIILAFSCSKDEAQSTEDMEVFLSANVENKTIEILGGSQVFTDCHPYPDFEAWQINISGATLEGEKIAIYLRYYDEAGTYSTGAIGSSNWMYYSEVDGQEYGTIPVWWEGENDFIEKQEDNDLGEIIIIESDGYLEGSFKFKGFRSKDDFKEVTNGKFKVPFSRE